MTALHPAWVLTGPLLSRAGHSHRGLAVFANAGVTTKTVGAGLPAKGPAHPTSMLPDTPPSRASPLPQKSKGRAAYTRASHHSSGRALARLQLLIHPPPRQAEGRRSSGGGRAAPFGEAEHIERRSKRSRPEAMPPDECRSEGTPSLSEGPYVRGVSFGYFWGVCQK